MCADLSFLRQFNCKLSSGHVHTTCGESGDYRAQCSLHFLSLKTGADKQEVYILCYISTRLTLSSLASISTTSVSTSSIFALKHKEQEEVVTLGFSWFNWKTAPQSASPPSFSVMNRSIFSTLIRSICCMVGPGGTWWFNMIYIESSQSVQHSWSSPEQRHCHDWYSRPSDDGSCCLWRPSSSSLWILIIYSLTLLKKHTVSSCPAFSDTNASANPFSSFLHLRLSKKRPITEAEFDTPTLKHYREDPGRESFQYKPSLFEAQGSLEENSSVAFVQLQHKTSPQARLVLPGIRKGFYSATT